MATAPATDHETAFAAAHALSGADVVIGGQTVEAILSYARARENNYDSSGTNQKILTAAITVRTADLPTITIGTTVTLDGVDYRITDTSSQGVIGTELELESP